MKRNREENTHTQVVNYLKLQYPDVIFNTDMSGVFLTKFQAIKAAYMRSDKGFPDIVIYEPRHGFYGLFIELKREGEAIYKQDGSLRKSEHLEQQKKMHDRLNAKCYNAVFAVGFDEAKKIIDNYLR